MRDNITAVMTESILKHGNRDEHCHIDGHDWEERPYFWNVKNGWWKRCRVCGHEILEKDSEVILCETT